MAGTINLSLSQQFDNRGKPLSGGRLTFYQAGTTTPQNAYKDTALTLAHPNPIILDSSGRVPEFWLADGSIKFVLTDKNGVVQISSVSTQVLGPSSGAGGGSTVDSTTIFQTGDVLWLDVTGARTGWVRDNGRSIGSATSGATERANSDCQLLYVYLWTTYPDSICPVNGGRGASAAADWAANKFITLPDKRCYVPGGLADMGNATNNRFSGAPVVSGSTTTPGSVVGATLHTLTFLQIPAHTHSGTTSTDGAHTHSVTGGADTGTSIIGLGNNAATNATFQTGSAGSHNHTFTTDGGTGGGGSHNNVQLTVLGTFYRKL